MNNKEVKLGKKQKAPGRKRILNKRLKQFDITLPSVLYKGFAYRRRPVLQGAKSTSKTIYVPKILPDEEYLVILIPTKDPEKGGEELYLDL